MFPDYKWPFIIVQRSDHPYYMAVLPVHFLQRSMKHLWYIVYHVYHVYHTWMQTPPGLSHWKNGNEKPHPLRVKRKRMKPSGISAMNTPRSMGRSGSPHHPDVIRSDPIGSPIFWPRKETPTLYAVTLKRLYCAIHLVYWKCCAKGGSNRI